MNRLHILSGCGLLALMFSGCGGPFAAPLPARLDDETQKTFNEAWDKTLAPVNRFNNQELLDLLMISGAYQTGVDKLAFRSEKSFSGGAVIMEIRYERLVPERDLFTVTVQDSRKKVLRQEHYGRQQIETTHRELFMEVVELRQKQAQGLATPAETRKLEEYEARLAIINTVFAPMPANGKAQPKK